MDWLTNYPGMHPNVTVCLVVYPADRTELVGKYIDFLQSVDALIGPYRPKGLRITWRRIRIQEIFGRSRRKIWRDISAQAVEEQLLDPDTYSFVLATELGEELGPWCIAGSVTPLQPEWPVSFSFSVDPRCFGQDLGSIELQQRLVDLFCDGVRLLQASQGYISLEPASVTAQPTMTPYEGQMHLPPEGMKNLRDKARGYFWGQALGPEHIRQLGGIPRILTEAPAYVRVIPTPVGDWVYLQVSPDINHYTDDQLRSLRAFLRPILPAGDRLIGIDTRFRLLWDKEQLVE